jgi:methionine--tRNA ligase beta chain
LPGAFIPEAVAVVPGTDGKRKMSKSLGNIIGIFEDEAVIKKQVMGCFTDPLRKHADDPGHIEGNMVFTYLDFFSSSAKATADKGMSNVEEMKDLYRKGKISDVEVKNYLFESLMTYFADARKRYQELKANPNLVKDILEKGTARARVVAVETMREVHDAVGLVNRYSFSSVILSGAKNLDPSPAKRVQDDNQITIDEFAKVELRVGNVVEAENVEKSEKLIRLHVDFGPSSVSHNGTTAGEIRTIFTGVRGYGYTPEDFTGKQFFFVTNLKPRKMMGEESQGMILAVDSQESTDMAGKPIFVSAAGLPVGSRIR